MPSTPTLGWPDQSELPSWLRSDRNRASGGGKRSARKSPPDPQMVWEGPPLSDGAPQLRWEFRLDKNEFIIEPSFVWARGLGVCPCYRRGECLRFGGLSYAETPL